MYTGAHVSNSYGCNMNMAAHVTTVTIMHMLYVAALHVTPVSIITPGPLPCMGKAHGTRVTCMREHM